MFVYILIGILMFGFIIILHEFGHFITAKLYKVGINEFSIGMGPKLFSKKGKDNVLYSLRLLPIGGYVSMVGEDNDECDDQNALYKKPLYQRFIIISAGAIMNILLGFVIMSFIVGFGPDLYSTQIERFNFGDENGNLIQMDSWQGLKVGDEIIKVGNRHIFVRSDLVYEAMSVADKPVDLTVIRDGKKLIIEDFVFPLEQSSGVTFGNANFFLPEKLSKTPLEIIKQSVFQSISVIRMIYVSLFDTLSGKYGAEAVSGPVGVVNEIKNTASYGLSAVSYLIMIITMNVGIFNLLPFPALDGGRLLFLFIELVRGKPLSPKYEGYVHFAGMIILLTFAAFVTINDIMKLF